MRVTTREGYAIWSATYDQEQNPLILTEQPRVEALLQTLPHPSSALDVATGTGRWALYLARRGTKVVGIDESPEMLAVARGKAAREGRDLALVQGPLQDALPFPADSFDLVICALALCHVADLHSAVAACTRVLCPEGHLLITDFHPQAIKNGWETTIIGEANNYTLPNARHSVSGYLDALTDSSCDIIRTDEVLVREQPAEAIVQGMDVDEFMRRYGDWPFCLIILARRRS